MKPFLKREPYTGPVQAIILDWAGTTVDHGCRGPVAVFSRAFEQYGIVPTVEEVRGPMGKDKREHVQCMLHMDRIAALWKDEHGALPDESVTDKIYSLVQELMPETLADYAAGAGLGGGLQRAESPRHQDRLLHGLYAGHGRAPGTARRRAGLCAGRLRDLG